MAVSLPRTKLGGAAVSVIGTHHVALDPAVRGQNLLQHTCLALWWRLVLKDPLATVWWLFDTFSYKSYLAMTRTFASYWPRRDRATTSTSPGLWPARRGSRPATRRSGSP